MKNINYRSHRDWPDYMNKISQTVSQHIRFKKELNLDGLFGYRELGQFIAPDSMLHDIKVEITEHAKR